MLAKSVRHLTWNKVVAIIIFGITTACLVITTLMTKASGVTSAASLEGKEYLGYAAIAVHLGLPTFGIASGIATAKRHKWLAFVSILMVLLCGAYSLRNVTNFVAAERFSIAKQREAEQAIRVAREQAALKAAQDRQQQVANMVKGQLDWMHGTAQRGGRVERTETTKDMAAAGNKLIQDFAKAEIAVPTAPVDTTVTVRPDLGNQMLAEWTGWNLSTLQLSDIMQIVLMLLIIEIVGWPTGAQLWAMAGDPIGLPQPPPLPPAPARNLSPVALDKPAKALAAPSRQTAITVRSEPTLEWRQLLDKVQFPPAGARHKGPLRPRDDAEVAALRFLVWLGAYKESGEFHNSTVDQLYEEFCIADHREPTGTRVVKPAMAALLRGKVASRRQVPGQGTLWTVIPPPIDKLTALLERAGCIPQTPAALAGPARPQETDIDSAPSQEGEVKKPLISAAAPFSHGAGGLQTAPATSTKRTLAARPAWERGQWAMGRLEKAAWQQRLTTRDRKQTNRMRLTRSN